jgi:hypothetical protein
VNNLNDDTNILLANECLGTDSLSGITNAGVARDAHLARMEHAISDFQSPEAFEAVHNNYDSIYPKMSNAADRCAHYYSIILFSAVVFLFFAIATLKRRGRIFVRIQFNSLVKKEERSLLRTYIYTHT